MFDNRKPITQCRGSFFFQLVYTVISVPLGSSLKDVRRTSILHVASHALVLGEEIIYSFFSPVCRWVRLCFCIYIFRSRGYKVVFGCRMLTLCPLGNKCLLLVYLCAELVLFPQREVSCLKKTHGSHLPWNFSSAIVCSSFIQSSTTEMVFRLEHPPGKANSALVMSMYFKTSRTHF